MLPCPDGPDDRLATRAAAQGAGAYRVAWVSLEQEGSSPPVFAAFRAGMADLGYTEGKNLIIDAWWGNGSTDRLEQLRGDILTPGRMSSSPKVASR